MPKQPGAYSQPFTPSNRGVRRQTRDTLLRIDGRSFYALATGQDDALDQLYEVLPTVLAKLLPVDHATLSNSSEFRQLFERVYQE